MQRLFLILTSALFLAWTAWLAYLTVTSADPVVVSRPQIHIAPIIVVAELGTPSDQRVQAQIKQNYRGKEQLPPAAQGNVALAVAWPDKICGWSGPGTYLLALQKPFKDGDAYALVPIPFSPGYVGLDHTEFHGRRRPQPDVYHVVYPWTESVKVQLEMILGPKGG